jgi:hypothetical protein
MRRLDAILEQERRGEGGSTLVELELLADEMEHLAELTRVLYLDAVRRRVSPLAPAAG